ncbi:MAG: class I SAM-dependent methyltransferase [Candidatus Omnitrophica bacterium]|jgi:SAM-dependent methyltransferase|nr:class I SAM-dependent methyltransferase [Candidatus Omnitrophota bacterium]
MTQDYKYFDEINDAVLRQVVIADSKLVPLVLDVGCGRGVLGEEIEKKNCVCWGIEMHPQASAESVKRITRVIQADLTDFVAVKGYLGEILFDYIIFADVLEHILEPREAVKFYKGFLKPGAKIIFSFPNTVSWLNRINFLFGNFDYTDTGIMDRGHIRFFTLASAKNMLLREGFTIEKIDYIPYFVRALQPFLKKIMLRKKDQESLGGKYLMQLPCYKFYLSFIQPVEYVFGYLFKSLFAFKIVIVGRNNGQ